MLFLSLLPTSFATETHLDRSVLHPVLAGYTIIARRDRDGVGGGVAVFVADSYSDVACLTLSSAVAEHVCLTVYCYAGPILLGCWCRPPYYTETESFDSLGGEWESLEKNICARFLFET